MLGFVFGKFLKIFRKFYIWTLDSLEMEVFENRKNLFDSAQANTERSQTPRNVLACAESDSAQC